MITLKSAREIEAMDRAGDFLASIHIGLRDLLKPGVDMWEVEEYVRRRCKEENVLPLQIGVAKTRTRHRRNVKRRLRCSPTWRARSCTRK